MRVRALLLAGLAYAVEYAQLPPRRCGLQNVPHDPNNGTRVAIALFGLVRHNCTMPNFERMVLAPLLHHRPHPYTVDVVLHANVVERITNARTNERAQELPGAGDWARFAPCRYALEDQDALDMRLERLKRWIVGHTLDSYSDGGESVMNLLRALYSLKQSALLVEARERALGRAYHVVVSVRVDTIFTRELPGWTYEYVRRSPVAKIFVPHFGCSINGDMLVNDRFAVGDREAMLDIYLSRIDTVGNYSGATDGSRHAGLTGERHLLNTIRSHGVPMARMYEFCLRRVRAGGRIWIKLFTSLDGSVCPLETVDYCGRECMARQPRCAAGIGCRQRGIHTRVRFFDGNDWCNDPRHPYTCRFDFEKLGFEAYDKDGS